MRALRFFYTEHLTRDRRYWHYDSLQASGGTAKRDA